MEHLARLGGDPGRVAVAIEVPRGPVVEDDRRDALVAAWALRTDRPAFRQLQPDDPQVIRLRELSRTYDEPLAEERRVILRTLLQRPSRHRVVSRARRSGNVAR